MVTRLRAILTDCVTPRLDFVGDNVFTIHLYALVSTNHRLEYIIIATKSFSSNKKHIRNSELKFRNSAFYSRPTPAVHVKLINELHQTVTDTEQSTTL